MQQRFSWKMELFGGLRAVRGDHVIDRFRTRKTGALLAYLAFYPGMHRRETLIEMLWPDQPLETGRNNLRLALSSLRRQLEITAEERGAVLQADRLQAGLHPAALTSDVAEFEALLQRRSTPAGGSIPAGIAPLQRAVELYQGRLLPNLYENWIPLEEQRLEDLYLGALDHLISALEQRGEVQRALEYAQRGARLVTARAETERAIERLRLSAFSARPAAQAATTPGAGTAPDALLPQQTASELPPFFTRLIGRQREIAELTELLASRRLITLTGPGGIGKSRLGIEVLRQLAGDATAVYCVSLTDVADARLLNSILVEHLGLSPPRGSDLWTEVVRALAARPTLLLLDDFEQLLPAGADWVRALLENAPRLTLLLTSRVRLKLEEGEEYSLRPLAFAPAPSHHAWTEPMLEVLRSTASAQLFVDRTRAVRGDFHITAHNAAAVAAILEKLQGVPLAIELVAARAGVLAPAQMLARLQRMLDFPCDGDATRPARHRSLRAAIHCSLQLLPRRLRCFFSSLALLRGDFNEAAAQAVSGDSQTLDWLSRLQDCSLLQAEENPYGEMRFHLLEMLREAGLEGMHEAEIALRQRRHAEHFLEVVERETLTWRGAGSVERISAELDNIRAALDWAQTAQASEIALRMVSALWWFWDYHGHLREGRRRLEQIMALPAEQVPPAIWAQALRCAGWLALQQGDYQAAQTHLEAALETARSLCDQDTIAAILNMLGGVAHWRGEWERAYELYGESLVLRRAHADNADSADSHDLAVALTSLAGVALALGKADRARALCAESLPLWREMGDRGGLGWSLNLQGLLAAAAEDFVTARACLEQALELRRATGSRAGEATVLHDLAEVSRREGKMAEALAGHQQSLQIRRELHRTPDIAASLFSLGRLARECGDEPQARAYLCESLLLYLEMGDQSGAARCRQELDQCRPSPLNPPES
jgi:predicted ATPase/DNA-binding SARP family transcriptional activator